MNQSQLNQLQSNLHSNMDRLKPKRCTESARRKVYLHSNMDRLKPTLQITSKVKKANLHSNMDRLKPHRANRGHRGGGAFTFQYG